MASIIRPSFSLLPIFGDLENEINRTFGKALDASNFETGDWMPNMDIIEEPNLFVVKIDIPGVDPKNIDVHIENNILIVKGEREKEHKENKENFVRYERSKGVFYRRMALPSQVNAEKITAKSKNGVLEIVIPKADQATTHKVKIEES